MTMICWCWVLKKGSISVNLNLPDIVLMTVVIEKYEWFNSCFILRRITWLPFTLSLIWARIFTAKQKCKQAYLLSLSMTVDLPFLSHFRNNCGNTFDLLNENCILLVFCLKCYPFVLHLSNLTLIYSELLMWPFLT